MSALTRDQILNAQDLVTERVSVPEWGGEVIIRTMDGETRDAWEQSIVSMNGKERVVNTENVRERLVMFCAVDEKGAPLFTAADVKTLAKKSGIALERCARAAQRLNKLSDDAVEAAVKNSSADPNATSTTS